MSKYVTGVRILRNDEQTDGTVQEADLVFDIADVLPERQIQETANKDSPQGQRQSGTSASSRLTLRNDPGHVVAEYVLGPKNILRINTLVAH